MIGLDLKSETSLLRALEIAVFESELDGRLLLIGESPNWVTDLLPVLDRNLKVEDLALASPFLADFYREAGDFWDNSETTLEAGTWQQRNLKGEEKAFEAWALKSSGRSFLLIKAVKDFEQQRAVLQRLRDTALAYERLGRKISRVNEATEALETRNRELERVNELKSDFLASMSHELRTPLNAIIGFCKLFQEGTTDSLNDEQCEYLDHISRASHHLLTLVNEILDLAKIEAGSFTLNCEWFSFSEALTQVLSTIRPLARAKNIRIKIEADPRKTIFADQLRFRQILFNLMNNAIKFTPSFGEVSVKFSRDDTSCRVAVIDNGIGIPPEEQDAIFQKFHQVRGSSNLTAEGSGLGLAITRALVEQHGGHISVESAPGSGACFSLSLPQSPSNQPGDDTADEACSD